MVPRQISARAEIVATMLCEGKLQVLKLVNHDDWRRSQNGSKPKPNTLSHARELYPMTTSTPHKRFSMIREFQLADWFTLANAICGAGGAFLHHDLPRSKGGPAHLLCVRTRFRRIDI